VKKILIIGATSAIAKATARIWAKTGNELFLVARNEQLLESMQKDLLIRGASRVNIYQIDFRNFEKHSLMLEQAFKTLGEIDIVLIAHGTLSNQVECEHSVELMLEEIKINALSVLALLTPLAKYFELQKNGVIAVIGSVAGDRGRQSNYVYGSAKGMLAIFLSGLRQRLHPFGVAVINLKPGFIDTPMTKNFKKGILWSSPEKIAPQIIQACNRKNGDVYLPFFWFYILAIIKIIPEFIFRKMRL
jgi:decaprenylphospho-beta-D-erythro-pentofuranosid-2-ulose 2-reductase